MQEIRARAVPGVLGLLLMLLLAAGGPFLFIRGVMSTTGDAVPVTTPVLDIILAVLMMLAAVAIGTGLVVVQPNVSRSLIFFGRYAGTLREPGFWLALPLTSKPAVSLKVRNFESGTLKVNDSRGNPIEIGAVVVWRVVDAARALFDVDAYEDFVTTQSETSVRHIASQYPYDTFDDENEPSLRGNTDNVSADLKAELQERLAVAGVEVLEARLVHLAYAPEVASAMLQRQQAEAVVAARAKIVEGAVSMVQMAVDELQRNGVIDLDDERKAAMINNLMVAIVSERSAQPVLNAGTLY
ncbi:MAG: SPFH domain-containing protein [Thermaerobacter sp.]|nr:hypothetical protein [Bacillota bacterium]REJ37102.1 MAG: hypothetical protein DIU84_04965 [Bacillota bacterium]